MNFEMNKNHTKNWKSSILGQIQNFKIRVRDSDTVQNYLDPQHRFLGLASCPGKSKSSSIIPGAILNVTKLHLKNLPITFARDRLPNLNGKPRVIMTRSEYIRDRSQHYHGQIVPT